MIEFVFVGDYSNLVSYLNLKDSDLEYVISSYPDLVSALKNIPAKRSCIMFIDLDQTEQFSSYFISVARNMNRNLHIIALTGNDSLANIRDIKEKSVNDIILKPLRTDRFQSVISKAIRQVS